MICPKMRDVGGLIDLLGDVLEERAHDDHVVHVDRRRQQDGPDGVLQAELEHDHEVGHDAHVEQHREHDEEVEELAAVEVGPGEGIGAQRGHGHVDEHAEERVADRVVVGAGDLAAAQQRLIALEVDAAGDEGDLAAQHQVCIADRHGQHVHQRQQNQQQQHDQEKAVHQAEDPVARAEAHLAGAFMFQDAVHRTHPFLHVSPLTTGSWSPPSGRPCSRRRPATARAPPGTG